jgi:hypothetical protein
MHTASISTDELIKMKHWQYFLSIIVTVGISFIKISVASFLLRLVPGKGYKIFLYCMIGEWPFNEAILMMAMRQLQS